MHAPEYACRELARLHPHARLAWMGRDRRDEDHEDAQNLGHFVLIQLYHISDCGDITGESPKDEITFRSYWDQITVQDEFGTYRREPVYYGPMFSATGRPGVRDYDPSIRVPVMVMAFNDEYDAPDGLPHSTQDVFSGKFLWTVRRMFKHIEDRVRESAIEAGRRLEFMAEDRTREMTDMLWFLANKTEATGPRIARKHILKSDLKGVHELRAGKRDLLQARMPPKAWQRGKRKQD